MEARTTLRVDSELLRDAKRWALDHDTTLNAFLEEAIRDKLAHSGPRRRIVLPVAEPGEWIAPTDLNDNAALRDFLDSPE